jgi:hypothetical protein
VAQAVRLLRKRETPSSNASATPPKKNLFRDILEIYARCTQKANTLLGKVQTQVERDNMFIELKI